MFVTKFDSTGKLVYSTYLGGSSSALYAPTGGIYSYGDAGRGIAVDSNGNAYITGYTLAPNFPVKNAFQSSLRGIVNAFVTKLDAAGSELVYSTYLGGSTQDNLGTSGDAGFAIAVDAGRNVYITGHTDSFDFITKNYFQPGYGSGAFVAKLNAAGTALVYATYLGEDAFQGSGIAVDTHGDAYVTGSTGPNFPTKNAFQATLKGSEDAFIAKIDAAGTGLVYSSYLGGSGYPGDKGNAVAEDSAGNAYVTGFTNSIDFPIKKAFQSELKDTRGNAFVTKISAQ